MPLASGFVIVLISLAGAEHGKGACEHPVAHVHGKQIGGLRPADASIMKAQLSQRESVQ